MSTAPSIPPKLWALMAEIGPRWGQNHSEYMRIMMAEFSTLLEEAPRDGVAVERDYEYGPHPRHRFDVFRPDNHEQKRPALLFVHGGAFTEGNRNRSPQIYSNVLTYFARLGVVGVNLGYRLAPEARYPEASRDVGAVVSWVRAHSEELGVDRERIFLMGHSAGGAHIGTYAYDRRIHPAEGPGLAGLIVISGRMRADNLPENPNARRVEEYYGKDLARYDECSALACADATSVPTFIAFAEFDNPLLDVYCLELAHRLAVAKRRAPQIVYMARHNHGSIIAHFNTAEDYLGRAIYEFIKHPR